MVAISNKLALGAGKYIPLLFEKRLKNSLSRLLHRLCDGIRLLLGNGEVHRQRLSKEVSRIGQRCQGRFHVARPEGDGESFVPTSKFVIISD